MIIGVVYIALICLKNLNELIKAFFKGMGQGYGSVIGSSLPPAYSQSV